jgi:hypothetical protein
MTINELNAALQASKTASFSSSADLVDVFGPLFDGIVKEKPQALFDLFLEAVYISGHGTNVEAIDQLIQNLSE